MFVSVAIPLPLPSLTYSVPIHLRNSIRPGSPVDVSVRRQKLAGYVIAVTNEAPPEVTGIKDILGVSDRLPLAPESWVGFLDWIAHYYHYPVGQVLCSALPPSPAPFTRPEWRQGGNTPTDALLADWAKRGGKRLALWKSLPLRSISQGSEAAMRSLVSSGYVEKVLIPEDHKQDAPVAIPPSATPPQPSHDQARALEAICESLESGKFTTCLLEGVTGSGKTEIYINAATRARQLGKSVLILAPEIALTPMLFSRFQSRIREPIAILHSGISDRERSRQWQRLGSGSIMVAIGARSSILAPLVNPGLIIVDEEHDSAFKQEDRLRYNARDMAILLGSRTGATVVLGSATPSLETYHNARTGKYRHLELRKRITGHPLPEVRLVDLRKCSMEGSLSPPLKLALEETLASGRQAMLLLNRRGYSSYLICTRCGHVPQCPNCSVSLTWYQKRGQMRCHYCGFTDKAPKCCKECECPDLNPGVRGTESLEEEVRGLFPKARVLRIDRESMSGRGTLEEALLSIAKGEADIIVGTQMIAKGHDFPGVTLVGVIDADSAINIPDFRSAERAFQLFTQMAGRAGRGDWSGKVIIQTYNPDHPSILWSSKHDFRAFAEWELENRLNFRYPPFCRIARVLTTDTSETKAREAAEKIAAWSQNWAEGAVEVLGPAPSLLSKIQSRFRWNILLKATKPQNLHRILASIHGAKNQGIPSSTVVQIDVDPATLM